MPGVAGYAEPQVSGPACVPDGAGVAHWCRAGDHRVVFTAMPGTQHRDVSPVYVVQAKNFAVLISNSQCCWVMLNAAQ
jgi:hypothetical protein